MHLLLVSEAKQNESTDLVEMPKYPMDFIESAPVSLWDISYLSAVPPQMEANVVVSAASV